MHDVLRTASRSLIAASYPPEMTGLISTWSPSARISSSVTSSSPLYDQMRLHDEIEFAQVLGAFRSFDFDLSVRVTQLNEHAR